MKGFRSLIGFATFAVLVFFTLPSDASAQQPQNQPDAPVDSATRSAVIDALVKELNDSYVFPDTAKKIESDLKARLAKNEYDSISSSQKFATKLTEDLQSVSHDKHLRVRFSPNIIAIRPEKEEPNADE